jgi:saccharopine dehydrogenase-like NADP-dependent oxidoreductase
MNTPANFEIGIIGSGVVGARVASQLHQLGYRPRIAQLRHATDLFDCSVVVLAHGAPHSALAATFVAQGIAVVSVSDNLADVLALLDIQDRALARNVPVIVGAACSPGMSGLLVHHVTRAFESIDEVHVAVHGTGGPQCARQHHESLAGVSIGWHEGEWLQRPAGSGRELCWFPEPVGARDCYRYGSPEPVLLQRINPTLQRITARVSATRRDRLTARLPMLSPPHAEGNIGGLRVEVRGVRDGRRHVEIVGIAERVATITGSVAAHAARAMCEGTVPAGVHNLGQHEVPNDFILDAVVDSGTVLHQFVGR